MHHAGAAQLDPARVLADTTTRAATLEAAEIELGARLSERKVGRPETSPGIRSEHTAQKLRYRAFQVRHRDAAVHTQSFNLKKHWIVSRIRVSRRKTRPGAIMRTG